MAVVVVLGFLRAVVASQSTNLIQIDINSITKGRSIIYPFPGRTCSDGSMYAYVVTRGEKAKPNKNGKFEKVMVTFMEGGACFDYRSCMGQIHGASYTNNFEGMFGRKESLQQIIRLSKLGRIIAKTNNCMLSEAGLLPCSSPKFADYVSLLIPYCTGDIHVGTQTATYYKNERTKSGRSVTIRHHGALHVLDLLPAFVAATGSPSNARHLIVSGGSAGGWGGLFWGGPIMEAFERTSAPSFRGKLRTHVLVDSAFQVPLDDPAVVTKIFRGVKWGQPAIKWRDDLKPIQPKNLVKVLKQQLRHYAGRFRMAFVACDHDAVDEGYADYVYPRFGVDSEYSRVAGMWKFLGDIHRFDSSLGPEADGSDSRVFSFIADCDGHLLTEHITVDKKPLPGNERAPDLGDWVHTFLTTGYPYTISPTPVRVGGPSYLRYRPHHAAALTQMKADRHADKYWCCVRDLDHPGTSYQKGNFLGSHSAATVAPADVRSELHVAKTPYRLYRHDPFLSHIHWPQFSCLRV